VFRLAHLVVLRRPGAPLDLPGPLAALTAERRVRVLPKLPAGTVLVLDLPMRPISSTAVRAALGAGAPTGDLLPADVSTYITDHRLYGVRSDPGSIA
jgi:nicotinate-nucleotide adenylyltransferase